MSIQDKFNKANVIYKITKDIDLGGETLTIPEGCTLDFQGGSFSNGKIIFNQTKLKGSVCLRVRVGGKIKGGASLDWFAEDYDEVSDILNDLAQCSSYISIPTDAKYIVSKDVYLTNLVKIEGHGNSVLVMTDATMYVAYANILKDFTLQISKFSDVPEGSVPKSALVIDEHHVMSSIDDTIKHNRGWSNSRIILDNLYFVTQSSENFHEQESAAFSILGNGDSLYSGYWSIALTDIKVVADVKYGCYINGVVNPEINSWLNTIRFSRCNIQNNIYPWYILNVSFVSITECSTQCAQGIMESPVYMRNTHTISFDNTIFHDTHVLVKAAIDADHTCKKIYYNHCGESIFPFKANIFPRAAKIDLVQNYIPLDWAVAPLGENSVLTVNQVVALPSGKYLVTSDTATWLGLNIETPKAYMIVDEHGAAGASISVYPVTYNNYNSQYCYKFIITPDTMYSEIGEFKETDGLIKLTMWRTVVLRGLRNDLNYGTSLYPADFKTPYKGWTFYNTSTKNLTVYNGSQFIRYDGYPDIAKIGKLDTLVNLTLTDANYGYLFFLTDKNIYVTKDYSGIYKDLNGSSISSHRGSTGKRPLNLAPIYKEQSAFPTFKEYMYVGYTILRDKYYILTAIDEETKELTWTSEEEFSEKVVSSGINRYGWSSQRPSGDDIYVGFEYVDYTFRRRIYAKSISDGVVTWGDRGIDYITDDDIGFQYYDTDLKEWLVAKKILTYGGITWVSANKPDISTSGKYDNKPTDAPVGHQYFCTDRSTVEGATNGIMIYHKGNDVWVDALGRVVE